MLPQHLLSCLATNHLCPTATELYRALVRQQCSQGQGDVQAELWAQHWLPLLSRALRSPLPILHSNAANHLLPWTLRQLPAAGTLLAAQFSGADTAALRAWVSLLRVQRSTAGVTPLRAEEIARLQACLRAREEGVRLAALGLLCGGPGHSLAGTEERLLREFLPLNLNCHTSAFRQLLQAALRKVLGRLRDGALARLRGKDPREPRGEGVGQPARAVGEAATAVPPHGPEDLAGGWPWCWVLPLQTLWSGCCSFASPRSPPGPTTRGRRRLYSC